MQKMYSERGFYDESIRCFKCGWEGSGHDVNIVDLYGLAKVKEVHCPKCDTHLAGIEKASSRRDQPIDRRYGGDPFGNQFG